MFLHRNVESNMTFVLLSITLCKYLHYDITLETRDL